MTYKKLPFILFLITLQLLLGYGAFAQSSTNIITQLEKKNPNEGTIRILQSPALNDLINKYKRINNNEVKGYRIQIYMGTGSNARTEANEKSIEFTKNFPDFDASRVYAIYETPYFKLRIGDYRAKNEAFEDLFEIKKIFPKAYIVNSPIRYPKL